MIFSSEPLALGTPAPPILCRDDRGESFDSASLRGRKVVLVFYPADNTPTCTAQLCELRDAYEEIERAGAVVVGINSFGAESHAAFRAKHNFPYRLLADRGKRVAKLYQASGLFVVKRTVYVVDEEGLIRFGKRGKPSISEILEALGASGK
jgi:thioredoxin-dependent peroxiredoxin